MLRWFFNKKPNRYHIDPITEFEVHPTDENGKYVRASDNNYRLSRGNLFFINNAEIAWFKEGDVIEAPFGCGYIVKVDCKCCWYVVQTHSGQVYVNFEHAKRCSDG